MYIQKRKRAQYEKCKEMFRGGGNRSLGRDIVRKIELAAKQPGSEAAKRNLDAKMQRGEEAKSVSRIAAISRHSEENSNFIPKNLLLSNQEIDNSRNSRHSERQRKNPADYYNTSKLKGIHMKNFFETDHASKHLGIFASKNLAASPY